MDKTQIKNATSFRGTCIGTLAPTGPVSSGGRWAVILVFRCIYVSAKQPLSKRCWSL